MGIYCNTVGWCGSIKRRVPPRSGSCILSVCLFVSTGLVFVRSVVVVVREQACFEGSGFRALDPAPHPAPFLATYQLLLLRVPSSKISQREQAMGERANSSQRLLYNERLKKNCTYVTTVVTRTRSDCCKKCNDCTTHLQNLAWGHKTGRYLAMGMP